MKLKLHHHPNSRSQRIIWLLEELQLDYQLEIHSTHTKNVNGQPLKFPTLLIQDNDAQNQLRLTETSAIAEYLCQKQQKLIIYPNQQDYWSFCFYQHYADASFMPNLALKQVFRQIAQQTPWLVRFVSIAFKAAFNKGYLNPEIQTQLQILNTYLEKNHAKNQIWLTGEDFTYADILLWFPLQASAYAYPDFAHYPALVNYLQQIKSRPAFQASLQKGRWSADLFQHYWQITSK